MLQLQAKQHEMYMYTHDIHVVGLNLCVYNIIILLGSSSGAC